MGVVSPRNLQKWVSIGYMGVAIVVYLLIGRITEMVWDLARWPYPDGWPMTPPELTGFVSAIITFIVLRRTMRVNVFMNEAAAELVKVTYPAKKETWLTTGVVSFIVVLSALILALYDVVWGWGVRLLY
ncbi:MAG: preprotein translocase subunit SecE [Deltaproteobacteria bacterium]|nr:preprotein translocase subunit SecE [Deltaproteobacteria bacterium]